MPVASSKETTPSSNISNKGQVQLLPVAPATSPRRRISSGSNGYYSENDHSPSHTPKSTSSSPVLLGTSDSSSSPLTTSSSLASSASVVPETGKAVPEAFPAIIPDLSHPPPNFSTTMAPQNKIPKEPNVLPNNPLRGVLPLPNVFDFAAAMTTGFNNNNSGSLRFRPGDFYPQAASMVSGFEQDIGVSQLPPVINITPVAQALQALDLNAGPGGPAVGNGGQPWILGQGQVQGQTSYGLTPEALKMSPCLRAVGSPGAEDLGNYAMHINQMELVWHGEFDRLFTQYYPHNWYLIPTFYPPSDRWRVFKDSAKVRFSCQECGHGWTSMKGRVIFWFHLNYSTNSGFVMFKLYGQQCQKCKNGNYEHAMWYPEEVIKVIGNVYNRVGQIFYGFVRPPLRIDRRQGKPRNQHNAELCQACKEGLCKEEWSFS